MPIKNHKRSLERGIAAGAIVAIVAVVALASVAGLAFYVKNNPKETVDGTSVVYEATTTTDYEATTTSTATEQLAQNSSGNNSGSRQTATVSQAFPRGPYYHNSIYGLTVPGSYNVVPTAVNTYGGIQAAASYSFYYNGTFAFTVNVFSKEEWNDIRIQETLSADAGTTNAYLGEGTYLGENKNWIFSVIPTNYVAPTGVLFY